MTLAERIDAAIDRVKSGQAPMRVPVDPTDLDIVLADCELAIAARDAEIATLRAELEAIPERRLMAAVLEEVLVDLAGRGRVAGLSGDRAVRAAQRAAEDARGWLLSDDVAWPFSARNICDHLGIDLIAVRAALVIRPAGDVEERP